MYKIFPRKNLKEKWNIQGSKSLTNRYLILCSQKNENCIIENFSRSQDSVDLMEALKLIGVQIETQGNKLLIRGNFPIYEKKVDQIISIGEGAAPFRFLLALLSKGVKRYCLNLHPNLIRRPHEPLYNFLRNLGTEILQEGNHVFIQGPCRGSSSLPSSEKSSQYLSAIKLAKLDQGSNLDHCNAASKDYLLMTDFCIQEAKEKSSFYVKSDQSSLSFATAWGCFLKKKFSLPDTMLDSCQPDHNILKEIEKFGFTWKGGQVEAKRKPTVFREFDLSKNIDLFAPLFFLSATFEGESVFKGIENLEYKESARLDESLKLFTQIGIETNYCKKMQTLKIIGNRKIVESMSSFSFHGAPDHRIVMLAVLFMFAGNGGVVNEEAMVSIKKSFPNFLSAFSNEEKHGINET